MSAPFRIEPDPQKRPTHSDPFLEFESERASLQGLLKPSEDLRPSLVPSMPPPREPGRSAINPTVAFALGVAGLVTAAVGYYQMAQMLATRSDAPGGNTSAATAPASVKPVGGLEITSDPVGAAVKVDGTARGVTPLTLREIPAGRHRIVISRGSASVTRDVDLAAGSTSFVAAVLKGGPASPPAAGASAPTRDVSSATTGWITVQAPIDLRVLERGRLRGTTRGGRINLAEGSHELEFVSDRYEIKHSVVTTVTAGQPTRVSVPLPSGSLSINATPWADVWVDGNSVGTTPLANLTLGVGPHEVVLRHPTLGERRQVIHVRAITPERVGVSFR